MVPYRPAPFKLTQVAATAAWVCAFWRVLKPA